VEVDATGCPFLTLDMEHVSKRSLYDLSTYIPYQSIYHGHVLYRPNSDVKSTVVAHVDLIFGHFELDELLYLKNSFWIPIKVLGNYQISY
jgi:hypothetical protein